ncbi:MAG: hydrogenase expression/formation protein HypE [Thermoleophilia bacterium]|jgi:hydrogenase expression/formation protein HypE
MNTLDNNRIQLGHGSGGKLTQELIESVFASRLNNPILARMDDAAIVELQGRLAITVDCHVVSPLFFPGGDIGRLSVTGTVNDLAMVGATALYLTAGFIIEEGFSFADLERIIDSMSETAREAGIQIVAGDTKVVEKGAADGIFITTSGVGLIPAGIHISGSGARPGDAVIVSGSIGDHGVAILCQREGMNFETSLRSDCAPLGKLVRAMVDASPRIRSLRDPTRGGLATTLNEIASASGVTIEIDEEKIPMRAEVRAACELTGLDPLMMANEGKLLAIVAAQDAERLVDTMRQNIHGKDAAIVGSVGHAEDGKTRVYTRTLLGSRRVLSMATGEQLPRIC